MDEFETAAKARRQDTGPRDRFREASRGRLRSIISTKLTTALIGALSSFEKHLGHLWGHGLPEGGLSQEQKALRAAWARCRDEALNKGNNQRRALDKELAQYTVEWDRYRAELKVTNEEA